MVLEKAERDFREVHRVGGGELGKAVIGERAVSAPVRPRAHQQPLSATRRFGTAFGTHSSEVLERAWEKEVIPAADAARRHPDSRVVTMDRDALPVVVFG